MVINSFKFFPVATGEDFRDLLLALAASPPDAAKPTKFDQFDFVNDLFRDRLIFSAGDPGQC